MAAYYNENNPHAATVLENLIAGGHIAPGLVDRRDIRDVRPGDLAAFAQCHFFAGIGVWSYALRCAGWPDDAPVWTGSCPCQPFSAAGKQLGEADHRHLWPVWFNLIRQCGPATLFGEQVARTAGYRWWDAVSADLEGEGYACAAADLAAASVGAPHIRQRIYWLARAAGAGWQGSQSQPAGQEQPAAERSGAAHRLANGAHERHAQRNNPASPESRWEGQGAATMRCGSSLGLADGNSPRLEIECEQQARRERQTAQRSGTFVRMGHAEDDHGRLSDRSGRLEAPEPVGPSEAGGAGPLNGFWRAADWLGCTDGRWRPVEPGTFPLAHGIAGRVGSLRTYGNAICAPLAEEFIRSCM